MIMHQFVPEMEEPYLIHARHSECNAYYICNGVITVIVIKTRQENLLKTYYCHYVHILSFSFAIYYASYKRHYFLFM